MTASRGLARKNPNSLLNRTPSDLGKISVNCSITKVNASEKSQIHLLPKRPAKLDPATAAPIVWADVLSARITVMGRVISDLKFCHIRPIEGCFSDNRAIWLGVRLNNAASAKEHMNETPNATAILIKKTDIFFAPFYPYLISNTEFTR
jgi:hypothetical protein